MIFAVHYFLWFSALTPIYGYLAVYAKSYANVSPRIFGIFNTIPPFLAILAKPVFCSLADRHRAYRTYFILFLILALFGWGSFGVLPFLIKEVNEEDGLIMKNWIMISFMILLANLSMSVISCLSDAFAVNQARKNKSSYGYIRVWGTVGWGFSASVVALINDYGKLPKLVPGLLFTIFILILDIVVVVLWENKSDFELDKSLSDIDESDESDSVNQSAGPGVERALAPGNGEFSASSLPPPMNNEDNEKFEKILPTINDNSATTTQSVYGTISNNIQLVKSHATAGNQDEKMVISLKLQLKILAMVINTRRSIIRYMILFTMSGALISLQWSYFFVYLEKIYPNDALRVSGLSMVAMSMFGELPFFIISQKIINILGKSHTLSLSIASIGVRYLLYIYLLPDYSMYFVFLTEVLQGPSFGLFYVVMTEVGMDYSQCDDVIMRLVSENYIKNNEREIQATRRALRATMQGLVSACYEGLGAGIGSVLGGSIIESYDFHYFWVGSAIIALFTALVNFLLDVTIIFRREFLSRENFP